jgi:hypothetical protein
VSKDGHGLVRLLEILDLIFGKLDIDGTYARRLQTPTWRNDSERGTYQ